MKKIAIIVALVFLVLTSTPLYLVNTTAAKINKWACGLAARNCEAPTSISVASIQDNLDRWPGMAAQANVK